MDIVCPGCNQKYHLDDEKTPKEGPAYFRCQKCKEMIRVEARVPEKKDKNSGITAPSATKKIEDITENNEIFSPDTRTALVYSQEAQIKEEIRKQLDMLGYETREARDVDDLKKKLKYNIYHIIFLHQKETSQGKEEQAFLKNIDSLSPEIRRQIIVIYILPGGNRHDLLKAFSFGVELIISPADLSGIDRIIQGAMASKKTMYRIFMDCEARTEGNLSSAY